MRQVAASYDEVEAISRLLKAPTRREESEQLGRGIFWPGSGCGASERL